MVHDPSSGTESGRLGGGPPAVPLRASELERDAPKPRLADGVGVDQYRPAHVALAVEDTEVVVLLQAAFAGDVGAAKSEGHVEH